MSNIKIITLPQNSGLTEEMIFALDDLFSSASPQEIKQDLQDIMFFMLINTDPQWYPDNFKEIMSRMYFIDHFLSISIKNTENNE